jgi:hypothetical protein
MHPDDPDLDDPDPDDPEYFDLIRRRARALDRQRAAALAREDRLWAGLREARGLLDHLGDVGGEQFHRETGETFYTFAESMGRWLLVLMRNRAVRAAIDEVLAALPDVE